MDFSDPAQVAVFMDLHADLPRQGPGNRASTLKALELAGDLGPAPAVLDIACGPGMQTMDLAAAMPEARFHALDQFGEFLKEVRRRAREHGCDHRVETVRGSMEDLPFEAGQFDLLWCEGAAYIIGIPRALAEWPRLLRPGGVFAFTECVWLTDARPAAARACWEEYPAMTNVAQTRKLINSAGLNLLSDFVLPPEAWWEHYYTPLEARLGKRRATFEEDSVGAGVVAYTQEEIDVYRQHGDSYGYAFFIVQRPG